MSPASSTKPSLKGVLLAIAAFTCGVLVLAGCTGSDPEPGAPGASGSASGTGGSAAGPDELSRRYLSPSAAPAIATTKGTIATYGGQAPVQAQILTLSTSASSTVLRWRLIGEAGGGRPRGEQFAEGGLGADTSGVALVSRGTNQRFAPAQVQGTKQGSDCACSLAPRVLGPAGIELSGEYAPLPQTITEIEVQIPGLAPVTVPVTRA
jgi:hypothetical protein